MRRISRRTMGLTLVPVLLIGVAGALRASKPLLAAQAAPDDACQQARSYMEVGRLLRKGDEKAAACAWVILDAQPLPIPENASAEVGSFSLEAALLDAATAMKESGPSWKDRCLALADRLETTPDQSERGYDMAWRIRRLAKG